MTQFTTISYIFSFSLYRRRDPVGFKRARVVKGLKLGGKLEKLARVHYALG